MICNCRRWAAGCGRCPCQRRPAWSSCCSRSWRSAVIRNNLDTSLVCSISDDLQLQAVGSWLWEVPLSKATGLEQLLFKVLALSSDQEQSRYKSRVLNLG